MALSVRFGDVEVEAAGGHLRTSIDDLPTADFDLDLSTAAARAVDYLAPVDILIQEELAFGGMVMEARPEGTIAHVDCRGGVSLEEQEMSVLAARDFPVQDIVYAASRAAGFSDDRLQIHGLDDLPREAMEILVPLEGVRVEATIRIGSAWLVSAEQAAPALRALEPLSKGADALSNAACYALVVTTSDLLYRAEAEALALVDLALSWLATRMRFGLTRLPDGTLEHFRRSDARTLPRRLAPVIVRSLESGRRWIRDPKTRVRRAELVLEDGSRHAWPELGEQLPESDRRALSAARRAVSADDPIERVQAFWEAWEFYVAHASLPELFTTAQREEIKGTLRRDEWTDAQRSRLDWLVGQLNQPSLMNLVRATLEREGVPITNGERSLLRRLRDIRNRAVHGAEMELPSEEELDHACSVLSRALVYRVARGDPGAAPPPPVGVR